MKTIPFAAQRHTGFALLLLALPFIACTAPRKTTGRAGKVEEYCAPTTSYAGERPGFWQEERAVTLAPYGVDPHGQHLCQALGITQAWARLGEMDRDSVATMEALRLEQHVRDRITLAQAQVLAVVAELECEAARAESLADQLDVENGRRNTRLTIASVIVGAAVTIATVMIDDGPTETAVGVGGGLVSIGLGALTIAPAGRSRPFQHERNLLRGIWRGDLHDAGYPYVVQQLLNDPLLSNSGTVTLMQSVRERWVRSILDGSDDDMGTLLFGSGGTYHADELHTRAEMLEQLAATVNSLHQDLASLLGGLMDRR